MNKFGKKLHTYLASGWFSPDHKFSIIEGFKNNISPEIIGNIVNLEFILASENLSKNSCCSIDKEELFKLYNNKKGN